MTASTRIAPARDAELAVLLAAGSTQLDVALSAAQVDLFVAYIRLVERWNATYNLTAIRDPRAMLVQHVLDCLAIIHPLRRRRGPRPAGRLLDAGTGAGLPGLVIAAVEPGLEVVCVDSVGKKAAFVAHAASALGIGNAKALHQRVETMPGTPPFDLIVSRAFASIADFVGRTQHLLSVKGSWLAMKGKVPGHELNALRDLTFHVEPVYIPGLEAERCLIWIEKSKRMLSR